MQEMHLYTKLLKDLLTKKGKYINNESIVVEGTIVPLLRESYHKNSRILEV